MRVAAALLFGSFILASCSSSGQQPCTLTAIGEPCLNDTDCCTGYCQLEGDGAYCQTKPGQEPACVGPSGFCTQDRNCCSGLCENGACFAGGGGGSCLEIGSSCLQADSCCSVSCLSDGQGHTACAQQPQAEGGPSCGLAGAPCSMPGSPDPTECCFGLCSAIGTCSGGGGGGGGNCYGAGASCTYGSDCCSGVCEKVSSGSVCH